MGFYKAKQFRSVSGPFNAQIRQHFKTDFFSKLLFLHKNFETEEIFPPSRTFFALNSSMIAYKLLVEA